MFKRTTVVATAILFALFLVYGAPFFPVAGLWAATGQKSVKADAVTKTDHTFNAAVKAENTGKAPSPSMQQMSGGSAAARAPFAEVKVAKATGAEAYTVAEIFAKSKELNGKTVRVRGEVVRYNPAIMGRNWIHIQDGTGDPMHNTHDLVATSTEKAKVGEIVTVEGKLVANKDFGAGYTYAAIIEKAKLTKK